MTRASVLGSLDGLLRGREESLRLGVTLSVLVASGGLYGALMGAFWADHGPRPLQMLYSALKVPMLLGVTFALSLPAYFVISTLVGLREDLGDSIRALLASQAVLAMLLASFGPFTLLWYASSADYSHALLFNGAMFGLASISAQRVLSRLFKPLIERDPRHRTMLKVWLITYAFIGIQMGWLLRPFVGNPDDPTTFLRREAWGNAYEVVAHHIARVLGL